MSNTFWLNKIKAEGVSLTVEIDLTFEQFRRLLEIGLGAVVEDAAVLDFWKMANRRILPPDHGSYSGIGGDINDIVHGVLKA